VTITINDRSVEAKAGESVLEAALRHDIDIPHLCYHPILPAIGACRMCLVEIEGVPGLPTACTTPVTEGMVVHTDSPAVRDRRRENLELILLEHPSSCLVCYKREACQAFRPEKEKTGRTTGCQNCPNKHDCEVQRLTLELGITDLPVGSFYREDETEHNDPFIENDPNLCILCGRCEQICTYHHGSPVVVLTGRGPDARVSQAFDMPLGAAGCTFCGACVDLCPTGSLSDRFAKWYGIPDGITRTTCPFCEAACALEVKSEGPRVFSTTAIDQTKPLCVLGRFASAPFLAGRDRLRNPAIVIGERQRDVTWEAALAEAAKILDDARGASFALVCDRSGTLEDRRALRTFTEEVMDSPHYLEIVDGEDPCLELPRGVRTALVTGDFLSEADRGGLDALITLDCYPSPASEEAAVVLPAAVLLEVSGHLVDENGAERPVRQAIRPAGQARQDYAIVCDLIAALGQAGRAEELRSELETLIADEGAGLILEREAAPAPALAVEKIRTRYRGHRIADRVPELDEIRGETLAVHEEVARCSE